MLKDSIIFDSSEVYDFTGCIFKVSHYDEYEKTIENFEVFIQQDEFNKSTAEKIIGSLSSEMQEDLELFANIETEYIFSLLIITAEKKIKTVKDIISLIEEMDCNDFLNYMISCCDTPLPLDKIQSIRQNGLELFKYIESSTKLGSKNKWRLFSIINEPDRYKKRFVTFIKSFYEEYYKSISRKSNTMTDLESRDIIKYIEEDPAARIKELTLIDIDNEDSKQVIIGFSHFSEFGISLTDYTPTDTWVILVGTRRLEANRLLNIDSLTSDMFIEICKVMGDRVRIEILKMMNEGPVYGTQAAEKLGMSNPAISYHMEQLLVSGLAKMQKEGHRFYYYLQQKRIEQIIKYLKGFIKP